MPTILKRMRALSYLVTGNPAHRPGSREKDTAKGVSASKGKTKRPSTLSRSVASHLEQESSSSDGDNDDTYRSMGLEALGKVEEEASEDEPAISPTEVPIASAGTK